MEADFSIELGGSDETLEFPWGTADHGPQYYDLKRNPELIVNISEAQCAPELREFLSAINASQALETAKCDIWFSQELNPEEDIFAAACKFCSYVDVLFCEPSRRVSFSHHEQFVRELTQLVKRAPETSAAAEFLVRRCYYRLAETVRDGFYITCYLFGYGNHRDEARQSWTIGLKLVENAIRQSTISKVG